MLKQLSEKFRSFCRQKIDRKNYIFILAAYAVLLCTVSLFHEPWSDEAQAWQIARCASLYDILFTVPHYEGHPPLWHLILVPFAKTGLPYEPCIKAINIVFSLLAVWVMLYKTKLADMLKLFIPFTYFIFYQYGVISRPYSIMFLALMLCAASYNKRCEKPAFYASAIIILCLSSAYGMAIACGLCIVWILCFIRSGSIKKSLSDMAKSGVLTALAVIFAIAVMLFICILPSPNCFNNTLGSTKAHVLKSIVYAVFGSIYDATLGDIFGGDIGLSGVVLDTNLIYIIPVSLLVWSTIILYGYKKGKLSDFLIPFALLDLTFVIIRLGAHHIGIVTLLIIYWLCICADSPDAAEYNNTLLKKYADICLMIAATATIAIQLIWSAMSAVSDIRYNYSPGREVGQFINENNITYETNNVFAYNYYIFDEEKMYGTNQIVLLDYSIDMISFMPYIDSNIFGNFHHGKDDIAYLSNKLPANSEEYYSELEYIKSLGVPKYIFGSPTVIFKDMDDDAAKEYCIDKYTFDYFFSNHKYQLCRSVSVRMSFKGNSTLHYYDIYELA